MARCAKCVGTGKEAHRRFSVGWWQFGKTIPAIVPNNAAKGVDYCAIPDLMWIQFHGIILLVDRFLQRSKPFAQVLKRTGAIHYFAEDDANALLAFALVYWAAVNRH